MAKRKTKALRAATLGKMPATVRNEAEFRTVEGHDVLITYRRFATISKPARKAMLEARRAEQLSRGRPKPSSNQPARVPGTWGPAEK
jgi:hypothetical protein